MITIRFLFLAMIKEKKYLKHSRVSVYNIVSTKWTVWWNKILSMIFFYYSNGNYFMYLEEKLLKKKYHKASILNVGISQATFNEIDQNIIVIAI